MRLRSLVASFLILLIAPCPGLRAQDQTASNEQVLNGIAAVVNSEVITFSQVRDMVGPREQSLIGQYQGDELKQKVQELRLDAVKQLIDNQLIIQEFNKNKFSIPDYAIDEQVKSQIKSQFGGDRAAFIRTLSAQGMTMDRYRSMVRDNFIVSAMRERNATSDQTIVAPAKIQEYYEKNIKDYSTPAQVHLFMIVVKNNGDAGKQMAEELRQKVLGGAEFDKLAEMYSEDPTSAANKGDWGWIDDTVLNESLTKIAFSLKPGDVSQVIPLAGSYYLLYVAERKDGTTKSMAEVHDDIENKLLQQQRQAAEQKWLDGLRQKAFIKIY
jgi:peptidyl-prolyl cis-trans isomerase SurA